MMDRIGIYIFRQAFVAFAMVLGTLIGILWLTQALAKITLVVDQGQTAVLFMKITLYALPTLVAVIAPMALFGACVHTLNRLNADSELVVVNAAGASRWTVIAPFVALGLIVTALTAWLSIWMMPESARALRQLLTDVRADVLANIIEPGEFTTVEQGMTFHIRERERDGTLIGVLVSDDRNEGDHLTYIADRGRIAREGDSSFLILEDGSLQRRTGESSNFVAFTRYMIDLSNLKGRTEIGTLHPRERDTIDLIFPNRKERFYRYMEGRFRGELHRRFAAAFYPLASVFIALAFVGFARTTRQNRVTGVMMAVGTLVTVRALGFVFDKLTVKYAAVSVFNYAVPVVAMIVAGVFALGYGRRLVPLIMRHGGRRAADWANALGERLEPYTAPLRERLQRLGA